MLRQAWLNASVLTFEELKNHIGNPCGLTTLFSGAGRRPLQLKLGSRSQQAIDRPDEGNGRDEEDVRPRQPEGDALRQAVPDRPAAGGEGRPLRANL